MPSRAVRRSARVIAGSEFCSLARSNYFCRGAFCRQCTHPGGARGPSVPSSLPTAMAVVATPQTGIP
eukprot:8632894-Alexandrium_andersonii.AAC.2